METTPEKKIGYVYNLTTGLSDNQQLVISGNLALDASKEEMGHEFDKLVAVTNRLSAKNLAKKKSYELQSQKYRLEAMKGDVKAIDENVDLSTLKFAERTAQENARKSSLELIRRSEAQIVADEAEIAALLKEAE